MLVIRTMWKEAYQFTLYYMFSVFYQKRIATFVNKTEIIT